MHPLVNIAIKAARSASKISVRAQERVDQLEVTSKGLNDFVTEIDKQSEIEIIKIIHAAYPNHAILGEEGGASGENDYTWIIDPIDGTTNFIHGHPHFSISIAIQYKDKIEHGVIYDPLRQELFTASRGCGAFLNERRIRVSSRKNFEGSIIGIGYNNKRPQFLNTHLQMMANITPHVAGIRRSGSAALDFAYTACGRLDAACQMNISPWDMAAGVLLIKEAGGIVSDFDGGEDYLKTGNVMAANVKLLKLLMQSTLDKSSQEKD